MTYTVSHRFCCKHHQDLSRTPTQCTFQSFAKYIILDNFGYDTHELACGMAELELFWGWTRSLSPSRERERGRANYTKVVAMNSSSKSVRSRQKKTNLKYCILNCAPPECSGPKWKDNPRLPQLVGKQSTDDLHTPCYVRHAYRRGEGCAQTRRSNPREICEGLK